MISGLALQQYHTQKNEETSFKNILGTFFLALLHSLYTDCLLVFSHNTCNLKNANTFCSNGSVHFRPCQRPYYIHLQTNRRNFVDILAAENLYFLSLTGRLPKSLHKNCVGTTS